MKGKCKLCQEDKDLIKKTHIIPEFLYQYLFDEDHKFVLSKSHELLEPVKKLRFRPTGEYEGGLLCKVCDNEIIGGYESYASSTTFGNTSKPAEVKVHNYHNGKGQSWSVCRDIDYKRFKLFLLSILWRASISTRPLFSEVNLGPHEDIIREMIFHGNAGDESDYPIQIWTTVQNNNFPKDFMFQPRGAMIKGHQDFIFPISGLFINFFVSDLPKQESILEQTIKKANTLIIQHLSREQAYGFTFKYLNLKGPTSHS